MCHYIPKPHQRKLNGTCTRSKFEFVLCHERFHAKISHQLYASNISVQRNEEGGGSGERMTIFSSCFQWRGNYRGIQVFKSNCCWSEAGKRAHKANRIENEKETNHAATLAQLDPGKFQRVVSHLRQRSVISVDSPRRPIDHPSLSHTQTQHHRRLGLIFRSIIDPPVMIAQRCRQFLTNWRQSNFASLLWMAVREAINYCLFQCLDNT